MNLLRFDTIRSRLILGFSLIFITFGATATAFGQAFRQALPIITPIAGLVIIAMGLHFLGVYRIGLLEGPGSSPSTRSGSAYRSCSPASQSGRSSPSSTVSASTCGRSSG